MGNIDSKEQRLKRGSIESFSVMGCQPNRIRRLKDSDNLSLQHLKNFNNKKKQNSFYNNTNDNKHIKTEQCNEDQNNDAIYITVTKHRSLSPQFSNRYESKLISQCESSNNTFSNYKVLTSPIDNANIQSNKINRKSINRSINMRRAKSFRTPNGLRSSNNSFQTTYCLLTGLNDRQKKLIIRTWCEIDYSIIRNIAQKFFESLFINEPCLLKFIGLKNTANFINFNQLKQTSQFRIHLQRFCDVLNEVIENLHNPAQSADCLMEFGADYEINRCKSNLYNNVDSKTLNFNINNNGTINKQNINLKIDCENFNDQEHIPISYWEAFIQKLSNSIKEIQTECQYREANESTSTPSPSPTLSNFDEIISFTPNNNIYSENIIDQISKYNKERRSFNDNKNNSRRAHIAFRNSDYNPLIQENFGSTNFLCADSPTSLSRFSNISNGGSLMRRQFRARQNKLIAIAEAWNLLAIYIVGQIRFGYELECSLQQQSEQLVKSISVKTLNNNEIDTDDFITDINYEPSSSYILKNQNTNNEIKKTSEFKENVCKKTKSKFDYYYNKTEENEVLNLEIKLQKNIDFQEIDTTQKSEEKLRINQNIENISIKQELVGLNS